MRWVSLGGPIYDVPKLGSFGSWTEIMASILKVVGLDGQFHVQDRSATEEEALFLDAWAATGLTVTKAGELWEALPEELRMDSAKKLGRWITEDIVDRVIDGRLVEARDVKGQKEYTLRKVGVPRAEAGGEEVVRWVWGD